MKLILGDQSIEFSPTEWERAKKVISETEFRGDENEVGVFTDEEASSSEIISPEYKMEFMQHELDRLTQKLRSLPPSKVRSEAKILGPMICLLSTSGAFKNSYRGVLEYLESTVTGPGVQSVEVNRGENSDDDPFASDYAQHIVTFKEDEESKDTEVSGDLASNS